jgi:DNA-binding XRE family transcriptional regulator
MKKIENSECLMGFGKFIKEGRMRRDMLQSEVAELVGISQPYYSMIEKGTEDRNVDLVLAMKICRVLRLNISDFTKQYM